MTTPTIIPLSNLEATQKLANQIAPLLREGDVLALSGGLGAGKTTFCRALISALVGAPTEVPSPTYTLVQTYDAPAFPIFHFDLYRLETPDDVFELGWDDTVSGLSLIEWPDKAGVHLPAWRLGLIFEMNAETRSVRLEPQGEDWQTRLHGFGS